MTALKRPKAASPLALTLLALLPLAAAADIPDRGEPQARRDSTPAARTATTLAWGLAPYQRWPTAGLGRPSAVAIGDVDADGRRDVLLATTTASDIGSGYQLVKYRQLPDGSLEAPLALPYDQQATQAASLAILDLDGQHGLDVAVGGAQGLTAFLATASGGLAAAAVQPGREARSLAVLDLDQDGWNELASVSYNQAGNVHRNHGNGTLTTEPWPVFAGGSSLFLATADFNRDGRLDVAVAGDGMFPPILVYLDVDGALVGWRALQSSCPEGLVRPTGLAAGDVNGDGIVDLVVTGGGNQPRACLRVHYGGADGEFATALVLPSYEVPANARAVDIDVDGRTDVVVLHDARHKLGVYLQNAGGALEPERLFQLPYSSSYDSNALDVADFTGDGCPDVAIASSDEMVTLAGSGCASTLRSGSAGSE